jgi:oligosaccharide repeat unit polymerase
MDFNLILTLFTLVLFWALLFAVRLRLSFIHIMSFILSQNLVGIYLLGASQPIFVPAHNFEASQQSLLQQSFLPVHIFEAGLLAFAIGIVGGVLMHPRRYRQTLANMDVSLVQQSNAFWVLLIVGVPVLTLGIMLFVLNGVPFLSENANELRFTITEGNGVFWRLQEFGIPMLVVLAGVYVFGAKKPLGSLKILFFVFLATMLVTSVMRGHKGGLLYGLYWVVVLVLVTNRTKTVPKKWFVVAPILLVFSCGIILIATQRGLDLSTQQATQWLVERVTILEAQGFYSIVQYYVPAQGFQYGLGQWPSILALLATFRLLPRGTDQLELGTQVSHYLTGIPPSLDTLVFPLTVTPFGDFYVDFGVPGVVIGGILLGLFAAWLYRNAILATPSLWKAVLIALQVEMVLYASRGSLFGRVNNEILSWSVVVAAYFCVYWLFRNFAARPVNPLRLPTATYATTEDSGEQHSNASVGTPGKG